MIKEELFDFFDFLRFWVVFIGYRFFGLFVSYVFGSFLIWFLVINFG